MTSTPRPGRPIRIAVVNDYEIVVRGLAAMLEEFSDRVTVVEVDSRKQVLADVDVALYDTFGQAQGAAIDPEQILSSGVDAKLVVFSWNHSDLVVEDSFGSGVHGFVDKSVTAEQLVALIEQVHAGESVRPRIDAEEKTVGDVGAWPGREHGLSPREAEVLALICQGLTNDDICARTYITLNTLKGYIRRLYSKIGVEDRANAILWGIDHGFRPNRVRHRLDRD